MIQYSYLAECLVLFLIQSLPETLDVSLRKTTWQNVLDLLHLKKFINSNQKIFSLHHSLHSRDVSQPSEDLLLDLLNILLTENTPQSLGLENY